MAVPASSRAVSAAGIFSRTVELRLEMTAMFLPLFLSASLTLPGSFVAPKGWVAKTPPSNGPVDFIWLSPKFGVNGNGENLSLTTRQVPEAVTLDAEVRTAIGDVSRDRVIVDSHSESSCHGLQNGWTFDARLATPSGKTVSQVYHLAIVDGRAYSLIFTHLAGHRIPQAITGSIQSICPSHKRASYQRSTGQEITERKTFL
jgi:hypothetical protein